MEAWGYRFLEVPVLVRADLFDACTQGTENRMFRLEGGMALVPEVTNYVRAMGARALGCDRVYYVTRCFREETTTDAERLREFTQIGVEFLGENAADCRKAVRKDALRLFRELLGDEGWALEDSVERGLNLYATTAGTFEIRATGNRKQLLGGGAYAGGAGWALGLERLELLLKRSGQRM
ncbi:MAG: ATP phosphoribosyltransferase regulatory subunit [Opitutales bacterium]|nr:ATP phosphoribosyltransferase regulatory subunit [Opitutales bacterium]